MSAADGTRALVTTTATNSGNSIEDTTLATVIDTTTGKQIGTKGLEPVHQRDTPTRFPLNLHQPSQTTVANPRRHPKRERRR